MRLFFAINLSNETKNRLIALQDELRKKSLGGNFSLPDNFHLTLAFLGECNEQQTAAAIATLNEMDIPSINITIDRVGCFKRNSGDIWWAGIKENPLLINLQKELFEVLRKKGFHLESRKYSPHITLGREVVSHCSPWKIEPFHEVFHAVDLMKSERVNGRLKYTSISRRGRWLNPIVVEEHNPNWETEFQRIKDFLLPHIGDLVVEIHHVGSTSVPGLWAKPIIDFDIEIPDRRIFPELEQRLSKLGYRHEGNLGILDREVFKPNHPDDFMKYHLYVCPSDSLELKRHLSFRNYLRSDPKAAEEYGQLKKALAKKHGNDIDSYVNGKSKFIESCLNKAKKE